MNQRLKASVWVDAQIRQCHAQALPVYVIKRGDGDAGMVLIKLIRAASAALILSPTRNEEGAIAWNRPLGADPVPELDADTWLERQKGYDPDLWIIEIEDPGEQWDPTAPIL